MDKIKFNNDRQKIISWINSHDHSMAEIEFVLSKAYPEGSEDSFYNDYGDLLEKKEQTNTHTSWSVET